MLIYKTEKSEIAFPLVNNIFLILCDKGGVYYSYSLSKLKTPNAYYDTDFIIKNSEKISHSLNIAYDLIRVNLDFGISEYVYKVLKGFNNLILLEGLDVNGTVDVKE